MREKAVIAWAALAAALCACGQGLRGDTWMARIPGDTLTLGELSESWSAMDSAGMETFLADSGPGAAFVEARAYRMLIEHETRRAGYMDAPLVTSFRRSWLRTESGTAMRSIMEDGERALLDSTGVPGDARPEEWFWLSALAPDSTPFPMGPFALYELPPGIAAELAGAPEGTVVQDPRGVPVRFDSTTARGATAGQAAGFMGPPVLDSLDLETVVQGRIRYGMIAMLAGERAAGSISVDTLLMDGLAGFYASGAGIPGMPGTILTFRSDSWTGDDIVLETDFFRTRFPFTPSDRRWMGFVIDNLVQQSILEDMLADADPALFDSLGREADSFALSTAFDLIRRDSVTARIAPGLAGDPAAESAATREWLDRLAAGYGLEINTAAIEELPEDPGSWAGLFGGS